MSLTFEEYEDTRRELARLRAQHEAAGRELAVRVARLVAAHGVHEAAQVLPDGADVQAWAATGRTLLAQGAAGRGDHDAYQVVQDHAAGLLSWPETLELLAGWRFADGPDDAEFTATVVRALDEGLLDDTQFEAVLDRRLAA